MAGLVPAPNSEVDLLSQKSPMETSMVFDSSHDKRYWLGYHKNCTFTKGEAPKVVEPMVIEAPVEDQSKLFTTFSLQIFREELHPNQTRIVRLADTSCWDQGRLFPGLTSIRELWNRVQDKLEHRRADNVACKSPLLGIIRPVKLQQRYRVCYDCGKEYLHKFPSIT